jgi:hypothetical protein
MRSAKADSNQAAVTLALRQIGASVAITSMVGFGFPDLVVGYRGRNFLLELKDGSKPPSQRKLRPMQTMFVENWCGQWALVESAEEAIAVVTG